MLIIVPLVGERRSTLVGAIVSVGQFGLTDVCHRELPILRSKNEISVGLSDGTFIQLMSAVAHQLSYRFVNHTVSSGMLVRRLLLRYNLLRFVRLAMSGESEVKRFCESPKSVRPVNPRTSLGIEVILFPPERVVHRNSFVKSHQISNIFKLVRLFIVIGSPVSWFPHRVRVVKVPNFPRSSGR